MTDREKLMDILEDYFSMEMPHLADHLLANGVTVHGAADTYVGGKWIRYEDVQELSVKYICPKCGDYHAFLVDGGSPFLTSERTFSDNFIYCRKCGKRNGGEDD